MNENNLASTISALMAVIDSPNTGPATKLVAETKLIELINAIAIIKVTL